MVCNLGTRCVCVLSVPEACQPRNKNLIRSAVTTELSVNVTFIRMLMLNIADVQGSGWNQHPRGPEPEIEPASA